jgi:hypothetical protein
MGSRQGKYLDFFLLDIEMDYHRGPSFFSSSQKWLINATAICRRLIEMIDFSAYVGPLLGLRASNFVVEDNG